MVYLRTHNHRYRILISDSYSFDDNAITKIVETIRRVATTPYPLDQQDLTRDSSVPIAIFSITTQLTLSGSGSGGFGANEYSGKGKFLSWTGDPLNGNFAVSNDPPEQTLYYPQSSRKSASSSGTTALNVPPLQVGQIVYACFLGRWCIIDGVGGGFWGQCTDSDQAGNYSWQDITNTIHGKKDDSDGKHAVDVNGSSWALTGINYWFTWDCVNQNYVFAFPGGTYPASLPSDVSGGSNTTCNIGPNGDSIQVNNPFGDITKADGASILVSYGNATWYITAQGCGLSGSDT